MKAFKRDLFNITMTNGTSTVVRGLKRHPWGLHENNFGKWVLTHLPTGLAFARASSKDEALEVVSLVHWMADWYDPMPFATCTEETKESIKEILAAL